MFLRACLILAALVLVPAAPAPAVVLCASGPCPMQFTTAGEIGGYAPGRLHGPGQVAVGPDGRIAVADTDADRVVVLSADGAPVWTAPAGPRPMSVAVGPTGDVFAGRDGKVFRFAADGTALAPVTDGLQPPGQAFQRLESLAATADGRLHGLVPGNPTDAKLLTWSPAGVLERTTPITGSRGLLATDGVRLVTADAGGLRVRGADHAITKTLATPADSFAFGAAGRLVVQSGGSFHTYDADLAQVVATVPAPDAQFGTRLAVGADGTLLTSDPMGDRIVRTSAAGAALAPLGTDAGTGLSRASGFAVTPSGDVVVADGEDRRVVRYGADGTFEGVVAGDAAFTGVAVAGEDVVATSPEGVARYGGGAWSRSVPGGELHSPAIAPDGTVWARDGERALHFGADGAPLGQVTVGSGRGLAVDAAGHLLAGTLDGIRVVDAAGATVRLMRRHLTVSLARADDGTLAVTDGSMADVTTAEGAALGLYAHWMDGFQPHHVAWGPGRALYVLDGNTQRIRRLAATAPEPPTAWQPPAAVTPPVPALTVQPGKVKVSKAGRFALRVTCAAAACRATLALAAGKRPVGRATAQLAAGETAAVRMRAKGWARKALARKSSLGARLAATVAGGADVTGRVTLRR